MSQISEKDYLSLKREVEEAKANADRAQGALDELMDRLKQEFDCDSLKDAKALLADLQEKEEQAESAYLKAKSTYEKKWKSSESE